MPSGLSDAPSRDALRRLRGVHRVPSYAARPRGTRRPSGRRRGPPRLALLALVGLLVTAGAMALYGASEGDPWWWLLNDAPPSVTATPPEGPRRGKIAVEALVRPAGRATLVTATVDGVPLPLPASPPGADGASRLEVDTSPLPDGRHVLRLEAVDRSRRRNRGAHEVVLRSDNTPPPLQLETAPGRVRAGTPVIVRWGTNEPAELQATWAGEPVPGVADPGAAGTERYLSLLALPIETPSGEASLRLAGRDVAGNEAEREVSLPVEAVALPHQVLQVPPALAPLATGPVAADEAAHVAALTTAVAPERRWSGAFRPPLPSTAPRSTGFGDRRDYADGYVAYHAGYDLVAPAGAPVTASADGAVVFAGPLPQRGNTVILDHGWGVYTVYAHLLAVEGQVGQRVAAGETVGHVGSTGLSTGPHLHWEVRLRGLSVDPDGWIGLSAGL